ncbi:MAG: ABC transporter permease [Bryobacteraceae bacterium]|jgi:ABC-type dipeptide/oligopeptide/nickel transport system permease subunit
MTRKQKFALVILGVTVVASLGAAYIAPSSYSEQFRDAISAPPSSRFWLGTDELGRDRFARLLYGTRVSLLLAPAAALLSTLIAALIGGAAGYLGGRWERVLTAGVDLFLSLPWLFLLLAVRALLPLNTSPVTSVMITFLLLGCLGWAAPARMIRAGTRTLVNSDYLVQASASGISRWRLFWRHLLPNLRPILLAQFWISVPLFILSEANLGLLGLGVSEPLPSWGVMLRELENYSAVLQNPWMLAPAILLVVVVSCLQLLLRTEESAFPC